jgi:hypothetical protein
VLLAAADPRIAARGITVDAVALHHATMGAVIAEDSTLAMEGNRPDVLSFDVRGRALDMAVEIVSHWKTPPADPDPASALRPDLEVELLGRLIASEKLRLTAERDIPRSASILLGGLAATWQTPEVKDVAARDEWLTRRFGEVEVALRPQSLTLVERTELEDALDPLERVIAEGLPKSRQALVRLRIAVQGVETSPRSVDRWAPVMERLHADAGMLLTADTLLAFLATQAKLLHAEINQLVVKPTEEIAERAGESVVGTGERCRAQSASKVRALEPPPERVFDCALRDRVIAAHTANENLVVLIGMHDVVVAAAWSVILARGGDDATIALGAPKPIVAFSPVIEGKLMRFAATHPVEAVTRALSIAWIMRNGLAEAALRAEAWKTFGDAPLDIIDRELHPQRRERDQLRQTSRP